MKRSELILEFIDGTLDSNDEQNLFDEMAHHPELRSEMRQFIAIGDAVRNDREAFTPPAHVEQALMSAIGLSPIVLGGPVGASSVERGGAAAGSGLLSGLRGIWGLAAAFFVGAILSGVGVYLAMNGGDARDTLADRVPAAHSSGSGGAVPGSSRSATGAAPATSGSALPAETSSTPGSSARASASDAVSRPSEAPTRSGNFVPPTRSNARNFIADGSGSSPRRTAVANGSDAVVSNSAENSSTPELRSESSDKHETMIDTRSLTTVERTDLFETEQPKLTAEAAITRDQAPHPMASIATNGSSPLEAATAEEPVDMPAITAEARWQRAWQYYQNSAREIPTSFPSEDLGLGAYARVTNSFVVGAEAGRERYSQSLQIGRADTFRIDQQPLLFWAGLTARFISTEDFLLSGLRPYVQASGGYAFGNFGGPVVRGRVGFRKELFTQGSLSFGLNGAFESSALIYQFNNQALLSGRYGATLGLELGIW